MLSIFGIGGEEEGSEKEAPPSPDPFASQRHKGDSEEEEEEEEEEKQRDWDEDDEEDRLRNRRVGFVSSTRGGGGKGGGAANAGVAQKHARRHSEVPKTLADRDSSARETRESARMLRRSSSAMHSGRHAKQRSPQEEEEESEFKKKEKRERELRRSGGQPFGYELVAPALSLRVSITVINQAHLAFVAKTRAHVESYGSLTHEHLQWTTVHDSGPAEVPSKEFSFSPFDVPFQADEIQELCIEVYHRPPFCETVGTFIGRLDTFVGQLLHNADGPTVIPLHQDEAYIGEVHIRWTQTLCTDSNANDTGLDFYHPPDFVEIPFWEYEDFVEHNGRTFDKLVPVYVLHLRGHKLHNHAYVSHLFGVEVDHKGSRTATPTTVVEIRNKNSHIDGEPFHHDHHRLYRSPAIRGKSPYYPPFQVTLPELLQGEGDGKDSKSVLLFLFSEKFATTFQHLDLGYIEITVNSLVQYARNRVAINITPYTEKTAAAHAALAAARKVSRSVRTAYSNEIDRFVRSERRLIREKRKQGFRVFHKHGATSADAADGPQRHSRQQSNGRRKGGRPSEAGEESDGGESSQPQAQSSQHADSAHKAADAAAKAAEVAVEEMHREVSKLEREGSQLLHRAMSGLGIEDEHSSDSDLSEDEGETTEGGPVQLDSKGRPVVKTPFFELMDSEHPEAIEDQVRDEEEHLRKAEAAANGTPLTSEPKKRRRSFLFPRRTASDDPRDHIRRDSGTTAGATESTAEPSSTRSSMASEGGSHSGRPRRRPSQAQMVRERRRSTLVSSEGKRTKHKAAVGRLHVTIEEKHEPVPVMDGEGEFPALARKKFISYAYDQAARFRTIFERRIDHRREIHHQSTELIEYFSRGGSLNCCLIMELSDGTRLAFSGDETASLRHESSLEPLNPYMCVLRSVAMLLAQYAEGRAIHVGVFGVHYKYWHGLKRKHPEKAETYQSRFPILDEQMLAEKQAAEDRLKRERKKKKHSSTNAAAAEADPGDSATGTLFSDLMRERPKLQLSPYCGLDELVNGYQQSLHAYKPGTDIPELGPYLTKLMDEFGHETTRFTPIVVCLSQDVSDDPAELAEIFRRSSTQSVCILLLACGDRDEHFRTVKSALRTALGTQRRNLVRLRSHGQTGLPADEFSAVQDDSGDKRSAELLQLRVWFERIRTLTNFTEQVSAVSAAMVDEDEANSDEEDSEEDEVVIGITGVHVEQALRAWHWSGHSIKRALRPIRNHALSLHDRLSFNLYKEVQAAFIAEVVHRMHRSCSDFLWASWIHFFYEACEADLGENTSVWDKMKNLFS